jgi:hypothetical protein
MPEKKAFYGYLSCGLLNKWVMKKQGTYGLV